MSPPVVTGTRVSRRYASLSRGRLPERPIEIHALLGTSMNNGPTYRLKFIANSSGAAYLLAKDQGKERNMTFVTHDGPFIFNSAADRIPPNGGTRAFWIDGTPPPPYDDCTITVTAHGLAGLVSGPQFVEVIKTEMQAGPGPSERILHFVVRNNGPRECPYIKVYVGVIRP